MIGTVYNFDSPMDRLDAALLCHLEALGTIRNSDVPNSFSFERVIVNPALIAYKLTYSPAGLHVGLLDRGEIRLRELYDNRTEMVIIAPPKFLAKEHDSLIDFVFFNLVKDGFLTVGAEQAERTAGAAPDAPALPTSGAGDGQAKPNEKREPELPEIPPCRGRDVRKRREDVRRLKREGATAGEIAAQLHIPIDTVKKDVEWLHKKKLMPVKG